MHDENGFLAAIRQTPADDTARLVFADWLDEQDTPDCKAKANFIRLELRLVEAPEDPPDRAESLAQLRALATPIPHLWLAVVSHARIEACQMSGRFTCPGRWNLLAPTSFDDIRRCSQCKRSTRFCPTVADANTRSRDGNSVAVSPVSVRLPRDLELPYSPPVRVRIAPELIEHALGAFISGPQRISPPLPPPTPSPAPTAPPAPLPPAPTNEWLPALQPEARSRGRVRRTPKRKKGRHQHRNLQREEQEEME